MIRCSRSIRPALVVAGLLLGALSPAAADEEPKKKLAPSAAARALIEKQGFAVEPGIETTLPGVYRFPKGPVFVTADAGLGCYLVLLRRILFHLGGGWDAAALPHLRAWRAALLARAGKDGGADAAFFVTLLERLHGDFPSGTPQDARAQIDEEIARLKSGNDAQPFPRFGTPLQRSPAKFGVGDYLGGAARWQVLVYLLTRVRMPEGAAGVQARRHLQETLPAALRESIEKHVGWSGAARLAFPGAHGVFDLHVLGDRRLPPGTLLRSADLPGLVVGADLGNAEARRRLAKVPLAAHVTAATESAEEGTLRGGLDGVLRLLADRPQKAPALFQQPSWGALELQTALGANVLFDRAIGAATQYWEVFAKGDHPGFVHPNPAYWRALSALATETAEEAKRLGIRDFETPTLKEIELIEGAIEPRLRSNQPFSAEELHLIVRCDVDPWSFGAFLHFGTQAYLEESAEKQAKRRAFIRERILGKQKLFEHARAAAERRASPAAVTRLQRLARLLGSMAEIAEQQLAGKTIPDLAERFWNFGRLVQIIFAGYRIDDPLCVCVPRLRDPAAGMLFQGCAGLETLWIRYPWKGEPFVCRGAVFSYRELVSSAWISDADWCARLGGDRDPPRPAWAASFLAR